MVHLCYGNLRLVLLILEFEIELLGNVRDQNLEIHLGEFLAKADSITASERCPATIYSLFPARSLTERIAIIPPLREKFSWSLPFVGVVCQSLKRDHEFVAGFKIVIAKLDIFLEVLDSAERNRCLVPEGLLHAVGGVFRIEHLLVI